VLWGAADQLGLVSALIRAEGDGGLVVWTDYMLLSRTERVLRSLSIRKAATRRDPSVPTILWTDDYSSLLPLFSF